MSRGCVCFIVFRLQGQEILIISSHPGIFSEHEEKQVRRRKEGDRDTDRLKERGENLRWKKVACNLGDFPWQHLSLPLFFIHACTRTHTHTETHRHYALLSRQKLLKSRRKHSQRIRSRFLPLPPLAACSAETYHAAGEQLYFRGGNEHNH